MAPIAGEKRKSAPTNDSLARSRKPADDSSRPSKRPRAEDKNEQSSRGVKVAHHPKISNAKEEEAAFPRGGGSSLTPLEHKQIAIDATRDVLFEQQGAKSSSKPDLDEDEEGGPAKKKSRGKESKGKKKGSAAAEPEEENVKIEGLNYKRIVTGSLVLGQVSQINDHDIALSLPNNLTGYVPITSISDKVTKQIEDIAAAEAESSDGADDLEDVDLNALFKIGQYLRAFVVSTSDDATGESGKPKRRIELSLRPEQANNAIKAQNVIVNTTLMASVVSVEDHGLIMDLGLPDTDIKGFVSSKELGNSQKMVDIKEGAVFLCMVAGLSSNGKIVKLSADPEKMGNLKKSSYITDAPTVDAFLPGTAVEILLTDITSRGVIGKIMGMVDVTADLMHSGAGASGKDLERKYKIGSKIKGRIICTFPLSDPPKLGVSLLDHVMALAPQQAIQNGEKTNPLQVLPLSTIIEEVTVQKVEPEIGLFVNLGIKGVAGFVHISRVKDGKVESLSESGAYKSGSSHRGRVIGYNALDGVYLVSLEESILEQPFLRIEDVKIGAVIKGKVEKIILNAAGIGGVLVNLASGISGLVPEMHMADVHLLHPEKLFKEGKTVTVRVLSTDPTKSQIRLTLKKSLVNSEATPFISYNEIDVGMQSPGAIINLLPTGAVVQFYGSIRGFLPVREMSEAYIEDPSQHFRIGQVVNVHVLKIDREEKKLIVSCKDPSAFGAAQETALKNLKVGDIVSASVTEKAIEEISVDLQGSGLRAILKIGHLTDKSGSRNESAAKKIRVGQTLTDLVVIDKVEKRKVIILSNKPSLVADAKNGTLVKSFDDVKERQEVHGFVKNITLNDVFVQFGGGVTGLLPRNKLPEAATKLPDFGLKILQSITAKVFKTDPGVRQFVLSMVEEKSSQKSLVPSTENQTAIKPLDDQITSINDLTIGKTTKARVVSVKQTQMNVKLADNIQGRIDVSQVFDTWDEIKDPKKPLQVFARDQVIDVRVLGIHDARTHRFLPISHRSGKTFVFELSAKNSDQTQTEKEPLTLSKVDVGSSWIAYINNIGDRYVWVNLSPNVRGRIPLQDLSDDVSLLEDVEVSFPVGSAIRVRATHVDAEKNQLDLSARSTQDSGALTFETVTKGQVVPGRVTRVQERQIMVQLGPDLSAPIYLTDIADDFDQADTSKFNKNDMIRVCVVDVDVPNKKLRLSTRPSRVLSSSLDVEDPEISSKSQLQVGDVLRGFVNNVTDKGVYVDLGDGNKAFVRVSDISDSYIKDWRSGFQVGQLVKGKIISIQNYVQMSLKSSVLDKNYVAPITFESLSEGDIVEGKIRKVEDFGVFIVINGSSNVSGLCHKSEMAEKPVKDVKKLYEEGDLVKAKVLKLDTEKKRVNFGLKASYINPEGAEESEEDSDDDSMQGVKLSTGEEEEDDDEDEEEDDAFDADDVASIGSLDQPHEESDEEMDDVDDTVTGLDAGGFDWSADILDKDDQGSVGSTEVEDDKPKKKRKKAEIQQDRTGDLDVNGPQSISDFERLLLGEPDSPELWIQYIAFQLQLGEVGKARNVAERAIKTINIREDSSKKAVWIALLNLEESYGTDDTLQEAFTQACQYSDSQEMHESLASIYIRSKKYSKADELFQSIVKKFSKDPKVWENYANFLHTTYNRPDDARLLLPRALQILPTHTLPLTVKFAAMEYKSTNGSPERGRTMFEGILAEFPKRLDLWGQLIDLELGQNDPEILRGAFDRALKIKGLKYKNAIAFLRRWGKWEAEHGDKKSQEKVQARLAEWEVREENRKKN